MSATNEFLVRLVKKLGWDGKSDRHVAATVQFRRCPYVDEPEHTQASNGTLDCPTPTILHATTKYGTYVWYRCFMTSSKSQGSSASFSPMDVT